MAFVGIDFGTSFSSVGGINFHGIPALFPDAKDPNEFRTPSVVVIGRDTCRVGKPAEGMLDVEPDLFLIRNVKLLLGTGRIAFVDHLGRNWTPEGVSALIIKKLLRDATYFYGEEPDGAVIAVPDRFEESQRRALRDAVTLSGIKNLQLVSESVAAATYYGMSGKKREQCVMVYDLGGGTFDVTVLRTGPDGFSILGTDSSSELGGKRLDEAIMELAATAVVGSKADDLLADPASSHQLRRFAEQTKIKFSSPSTTQVRQTLMLQNQVRELFITRTQFERLMSPVIDETLVMSEQGLSRAGLSWAGLDRIVLAGALTLNPSIRARLASLSGKTGDRILSHHQQYAVAFGACMKAKSMETAEGGGADRIMGNTRFAASDLGIRVRDPETGEPGLRILISQNTPFPAAHSDVYYTSHPEQETMTLELVELSGPDKSENSLGSFSFGPINNPRSNYPIEITVGYDQDGILGIEAIDGETGQVIQHLVGPDEHLSGQDLRRRQELVDSVILD